MVHRATRPVRGGGERGVAVDADLRRRALQGGHQVDGGLAHLGELRRRDRIREVEVEARFIAASWRRRTMAVGVTVMAAEAGGDPATAPKPQAIRTRLARSTSIPRSPRRHPVASPTGDRRSVPPVQTWNLGGFW